MIDYNLPYDDSTPLAMLTVGTFRKIIREEYQTQSSEPKSASDFNPSHRMVYGLKGIRDLFGCSHVTAQRYKDSFLQPAIKQKGRKIVVDAELALELFNQREEEL